VIMAIAGSLHIKMEDVGKKKKKRPPVRPGSKGSQASKQVLGSLKWCGVWGVGCGVWCAVCGVWCVVCGVWGVVCGGCGVWCVVCGVWCVVCDV
jgi:hypothetical protein